MFWKRGHCLVMGLGMLAMMGCSHLNKEVHTSHTGEKISLKKDSSHTLNEDQKAALANLELGLGYLSHGQVARAKSKLNHALQLGPELPETHSGMAHFLERVGELKEAEKEYRQALRLGRGKGGAEHNNYGAFLCRQSRYKEADLAFRHALQDRFYIHTAEVYENAGVCALNLPDLKKAEGYLNAAVKHDPKRTTALLELAALSLLQNRNDAAGVYLSQFKNRAEPTARSLWLEIQLARKMNDKESAEKSAVLLNSLFQDSPEYQLYKKASFDKT